MIVLASASPRRQELLRSAGVQFVVKPANIDEIRLPHENARIFAERMAREKARAVFTQRNDQVVLGADTVVVAATTNSQSAQVLADRGATGVSPVESETVLGKPKDEADSARMLRLLSGREHRVITGVCLAGPGFEDVRSETTTVYFSEMTEEEIRDYIASAEPMDKAGAYAIQGGAAKWISKIEGDYSNVVGLPVALVLQMLRNRNVI